MNKPPAKLTSENIILLYSAIDRKVWILNDPATNLVEMVGRPGDDIVTVLQRNVNELSWELLEAISNEQGVTAQAMGEIMFHLRAMNDITRLAKPDVELAEMITKSFDSGDLAAKFGKKKPIVKINS